MGKKKQSKLHQLNKQKSKQHKQQMKTIMRQLAANKINNKQQTQQLVPITEINQKNKKIKKLQKDEKFQASEKKKQLEKSVTVIEDGRGDIVKSQLVRQMVLEQIKPKVNIFASHAYDSGVRTIINTPVMEEQVDEHIAMEHKARQIMGEHFSLDRFGDKPLKVIEQTQKVQLSDDQDQPNSIKNVSYQGIKIPEGNFVFTRKKAIEEFRKSLPIILKEQQLVQTVNNNLVTLVCGETGSGKSTQLPQFLVQKNYHTFGKIAVTQPRRLATISLASRVADECNCNLGDFVGFQVRHQRKDSQTTVIKFMTDGILLNEMNSDALLLQYSVIVIDEAHERKINTDILIGLLSRVVIIRYQMSLEQKCQPLRLIIMSATMRIDDFKNTILFNFNVPILKVEARMFPVTTFYEKNTPQNYLKSAVKKCTKIHKTLPDGDVLVFLTGKEEIHEMKILLEQELEREKFLSAEMDEMDVEDEQQQEHIADPTQPLLQTQQHPSSKQFMIFQLYSSLPLQEQNKIFLPLPVGTRKYIIATNIAETSITIPNIRYVIDCGQEKHRYFDKVWKWKKGWGSKAMAEQRSGRAGRTAHGYCYRLYSAALYANIMQDHSPPEILKQPLDSTVLQLKSIGIQNVYKFPFPTKPQSTKISQTLQKLINLKAIVGVTNPKKEQDRTQITKLGQVLSFIPLDPKLGKMLLLGREQKVQKHILFIVILLTVENIYQQQRVSKYFQRDIDDESTKENLRQKYMQELRTKNFSFKNKFAKYMDEDKNGDIFTAINVLGEFFARVYETIAQGTKQKIERVINEQSKLMNLNQNTMRQVYYNTDQICEIFQTLCGQKLPLQTYTKPTHTQIQLILDILLETFIEHLCRNRQKNQFENRQGRVIHINNLSPLYMKQDLFVGCVDYYETEFGRTYMKYPFVVRNYQMIARFGQVKEEKEYVWRDERIVGRTTGVIYGWEIPNLFVYDPKDKGEKWIALTGMLISGQVFEELAAMKKYLTSSINSIKIQSFDYKLQKITEKLKVLKIQTKQDFLSWFQKDPHFLEKELQLFYNMKNFLTAYSKIREGILKSNKVKNISEEK